MQNLLSKPKQLNFDDIVNYYVNFESNETKIGLEYERVSLDTNTFLQPDFKNLFEIMKIFSKENDFELIFDEETIIGAKNKEGTSISLEPGGQFEISLRPMASLFEMQLVLQDYIGQINRLGDIFNVKFFEIGNNPKICYKDIKILNKRRYKLMAEYLFKKGKFAPVMMRETAGVQVNIDYKNRIDAKRKLKASCLMSPFLTGFFANSPFRNNKLTNYKSIRALAWKYTGNDRCNLFYKDIIDSSDFHLYEQYINYILDVPMIFIVRNNEYIKIDGKITFRNFMQNGYMGYYPDINDYITHQSLCFPDIRLKNCLEIRNHDSQNLEVAIGIAAIYKGILYHDSAIDEILDFLGCLNSSDLEKLGFLAARFGVDYNVEKLKMNASAVVKKILYLAQYKLDIDEQKYLDWLIDLASSKKCIADLMLENIKQNA